MSHSDDWDQELEIVERELKTVRSTYGRERLSGHRALIARKITIIQSQINLERTIERIRKLTSRDYLLLPREKTLLHWGQIYVDKLASMFGTQSKLLTKSLWLKLIKTRIAGPDAKPTAEIEPDDLVALAIRQQNLQKTERFLSDRLVKLRLKKKSLIQRYETFGVAESNRFASGSLAGRLGATPTDALGSPEIKALGLYVQQLVSLAREDEDPVMDRIQRTFEKKAARLVEDAKDMIIGAVKDQGRTHFAPVTRPPSPHHLNEFRIAML